MQQQASTIRFRSSTTTSAAAGKSAPTSTIKLEQTTTELSQQANAIKQKLRSDRMTYRHKWQLLFYASIMCTLCYMIVHTQPFIKYVFSHFIYFCYHFFVHFPFTNFSAIPRTQQQSVSCSTTNPHCSIVMPPSPSIDSSTLSTHSSTSPSVSSSTS